MKYFYYIILVVFVGQFTNCNSDHKDKSSVEFNSNSDVKYSKFIVATRPGAYSPKGLRKLSVVEMKEMGQNNQINFDFVCKDEYGRVVSKDYYSQGKEPRFMQMYVNENDVVVEAVVMEMSDEIRAIMNMMRFVSN